MNRRTFHGLVGLGVLGSVRRPVKAGGPLSGGLEARSPQGGSLLARGREGGPLLAFGPQAGAVETPAPRPRWPDQVYRRSLIDMHIPDWDPALLSKFDAHDIVKTHCGGGLSIGDALRQLVYGPYLLALQDRADESQHAGAATFSASMCRTARNNGLYAVAYYCLIYDNWAYEYHPDWRLHAGR